MLFHQSAPPEEISVLKKLLSTFETQLTEVTRITSYHKGTERVIGFLNETIHQLKSVHCVLPMPSENEMQLLKKYTDKWLEHIGTEEDSMQTTP